MFRERRLNWAGDLWASSGTRATLIAADGCADLIWRDGRLLVSGPTTAPFEALGHTAPSVGLRLHPGLGHALFGLPMADLRDRCVPLDDAIGGVAVELDEDPETSLRRLLATAICGADAADLANRQVLLAHADACAPAATAAAALGLSDRQLRRDHSRMFGYGYGTSLRIRRAQRAVVALGASRPPAQVAANEGFADQPHLTRELRALIGRTPGQVVGRTANRSTALPSGSLTDA